MLRERECLRERDVEIFCVNFCKRERESKRVRERERERESERENWGLLRRLYHSKRTTRKKGKLSLKLMIHSEFFQ